MKKQFIFIGILVLVVGLFVSVSDTLFPGTYAQSDGTGLNSEYDSKSDNNAKLSDEDVTRDQTNEGTETVDENETDNNSKLEKVQDEAKESDEDSIILDEEPLGNISSWWFTRNSQHEPPVFDKVYLKQLAEKGYALGNPQSKKIYLTFDEGYENGYTSKILDILKENNVKAAFFVTGKYLDKEPELVKRMVAEGHLVGNHTENHPSLPTITNGKIKEELQTVEIKYQKLTGQKMSFLRPPKGEFNERTLQVTKSLGYDSILWSMAYHDWDTENQPGKEAAYNHVMENIHNGAIILLHAVSESNTKAMDDIIKDLKQRGYVFASLDELKE